MAFPFPLANQEIASPNHPAEDWKIWTVVNPANWLVPWFIVLMVQMWMIHWFCFTQLEGYSWADGKAFQPVVVEEAAE